MKVTGPLLLWAILASPVILAGTEKIELTCDLDVTTRPPDGEPKKSHETAVVEMLLDAATGFKAIRVHSVAIPVAVANKKGGAVTSFVDKSDENRWDISNRRDRSIVASEESAAIDRNTGYITAHSVTTVGDASRQVEAQGTCAKRTVSTPTLTQVYERSVAGRVVWVGLTYSIGITKKEKEPNFEYDTGAGQR